MNETGIDTPRDRFNLWQVDAIFLHYNQKNNQIGSNKGIFETLW